MELKMGGVLPSVANWIVVGLLAVTFILAGKYLTTKYQVPGLSALFAAV